MMNDFSPLKIMELIATAFGIISVLFSIKKKIWVYPTGLISTLLYVYILLIAGLLGDMLINIYYSIMSIYGWILWAKHKNEKYEVRVEKTTQKEWYTAAILFVSSGILVLFAYYYTPFIKIWKKNETINTGLEYLDWANWLDIVTTAMFLVGMWLMAKRRIENWIFWIIANIISVPMYVYKNLHITAIQFAIFTLLAIKGYNEWYKTWRIQELNKK